jgi:hypothetical protein
LLSSFLLSWHKTLEDNVVEDKVDMKLRCLGTDPKLAGNKRKPFSQFQTELVNLANERSFKIPFELRRGRRDVQKLQYIRIPDEFLGAFSERLCHFLCFGHNRILVTTCKQSFEIERIDLSFKSPDTPVLAYRFVNVNH